VLLEERMLSSAYFPPPKHPFLVVFDVVRLEGTECTLFWRLWEWFVEFEEKDATNVVYVERKNSVYAWMFLFWIYR